MGVLEEAGEEDDGGEESLQHPSPPEPAMILHQVPPTPPSPLFNQPDAKPLPLLMIDLLEISGVTIPTFMASR